MRITALRRLAAYGFGPLTFLLMLACVSVFAARFFWPRTVGVFYISQVDISDANTVSLAHGFHERIAAIREVLPEIRQGQIWRLVTPVFVHITFLHIFFNLFGCANWAA